MRQAMQRWREILELVLDEMEVIAEPLLTQLEQAVVNVAAAELDPEQWVCDRLEYFDLTGDGSDHDQALSERVARRRANGNAWRCERSN